MSELLSPAGSPEALRAALDAGADAIYAGLSAFSARAAAGLDESALREAGRLCAAYGAKLYIALNTVLLDRERDDFVSALRLLSDVRPDGAIVQDLGAAALIRTHLPDLPLHGSTQMTVHSLEGVRALERLGFKRVVLARELSLSEIRHIARNTTLETEVFVHGALCMCYSGHCYFSSVLGGNSGNRGRCAQPCRLPYNGGYPLSLKDLCALEHLHEFNEVTSLKIEGRLKSAAYVAAVTAAYRAVLDGKAPEPKTIERLAAIFSRGGFTDGYLTNKRTDMFGTKQPTDYKTYKQATAGVLRRKPYKRAALRLTLTAGAPCVWTLTDGIRTVTYAGGTAQTAQSRPLDKRALFERFNKLADTPFTLQSVTLQAENIFLPVSAINEARRALLDAWMHPEPAPLRFTDRSPVLPPEKPIGACQVELSFLGAPPDLDLSAYGRVWLPPDVPYNGGNRGVRIDHFTSDDALKTILSACKGKPVLVGNIGHIAPALAAGCTVYGDYALNITNSLSLAQYAQLGLTGACLSFELSEPQIRDLHKSLPVTLIVYGRLPLMQFKNRVRASVLTDRKGARFPVRDGHTLYNALPLDLRGCTLPAVHAVRFDFTDETPAQVRRILEHNAPEGAFTRGLYHRGIR